MTNRRIKHDGYAVNSSMWNGPKEKKLFLTAKERKCAVNNTTKNRRKENDVEH